MTPQPLAARSRKSRRELDPREEPPQNHASKSACEAVAVYALSSAGARNVLAGTRGNYVHGGKFRRLVDAPRLMAFLARRTVDAGFPSGAGFSTASALRSLSGHDAAGRRHCRRSAREDASRQLRPPPVSSANSNGVHQYPISAHSWGSIVSGRLAGRCPTLIDRLVLVGAITWRQPQRRIPTPAAAWRLISLKDSGER